MAKIYLSPAAHATDNKTKCPTKCGENVHCNQYMDIVEARLKELGFEVLRGGRNLTGSQAMTVRVTEANRAKVDFYYVAHTNAGGGRYSMTMYYPGEENKAKADVFHKYRKALKHKVKANNALYEIKATSMPCLYDELFFHDNAEECAWFHNGGMDTMAEETVQALCEICGVTYKVQEEKKPSENETEVTSEIVVGSLVKISDNAVYSTGKSIPNWVKKKNWYVSSIIGTRAVLGKSEDGKNNINSPVDVKYLTKVDTTAKPELTPTPAPVEKIAPVVTYQVHIGYWLGRWLPFVQGDSDYAGISGKAITAIKAETDIGVLKVRVHSINGSWYDWVANNDKKQGGYAGVYGKNIDCVQMHYEGSAEYVVEYRVAPVGKNYLSWIRDFNTTNSMGYAGSYGKAIDRLQIRIVKK